MLIQYHVLEELGTMMFMCVRLCRRVYSRTYVTALRPKEVSRVQPDLHLLHLEIFMVHGSHGCKKKSR